MISTSQHVKNLINRPRIKDEDSDWCQLSKEEIDVFDLSRKEVKIIE